MSDGTRERLLASYGDMGHAMVVQNALESGGVPCRVGDLAGVPNHMLGMFGMAGRSIGVWVLEADAEQAAALLATLEGGDGGLDEDALAAEAMAAAPEPSHPGAPSADQGTAARTARSARPTRAPWLGPAALAVLVVTVLLTTRACG